LLACCHVGFLYMAIYLAIFTLSSVDVYPVTNRRN